MDTLTLTGKVALVTGSSRGIGKQIAQTLGQQGATIYLNGRDEKNLAQTVARCREAGIDAYGIAGDVTDEKFAKHCTAYMKKRSGRIDILVNNVGATQWRMFRDLSLEQWESELRANLTAAFLMDKAVVPMMEENEAGKIIHIGSIAGGIRSRVGGIAYSTAKSGLIGFTKTLALETGAHHINVNAVVAGAVDVGMSQEMYSHEKLDSLAKRTPLGRLATAEDIANAVFFFASPLSDFVTGQILTVDGGFTL
jgi:NAD(P)-dependent dehydrogenase (short-subunit alcohol dehydrogenase family)